MIFYLASADGDYEMILPLVDHEGVSLALYCGERRTLSLSTLSTLLAV